MKRLLPTLLLAATACGTLSATSPVPDIASIRLDQVQCQPGQYKVRLTWDGPHAQADWMAGFQVRQAGAHEFRIVDLRDPRYPQGTQVGAGQAAVETPCQFYRGDDVQGWAQEWKGPLMSQYLTIK